MIQTNPMRSLLRDGHAVSVYTLKMTDLSCIVICGLLAYWLRFGVSPLFEDNVPLQYIYAIISAALLALVAFSELGVYRTWRAGAKAAMYGRVLLGWGIVLAILGSISFLSKTSTSFSRLWFAYWALGSLISLLIARVALRSCLSYLHKFGIGVRRVAVVGPTKRVESVVKRLAKTPWSGFQLGLLAIDPRQVHEDSPPLIPTFDALPCVALDQLPNALAKHNIQEVWLTWALRDEARIHGLLESLEQHGLNIRWLPDIFAYRLINHGITEFAGMPMLDLSITPITGISRIVKELEDKILASLILLMISPVLLFCAIGVKLSSPGPILFKQLRHGWDGKEIQVWKFRSMKLHTEQAGTVTQAKKNDNRVTPFGAFLRRTSLDELPQFFNVLQGRMSIVGPRPHALAHNEQYQQLIRHYPLRHRVKPGITGWAQINGLRGETDTLEKMRARVEYDLYYIEHWSVWFDLRIIWRTATTVFFDRTVY